MWAEQFFNVHVSIPKHTSKLMQETVTAKHAIA